MTELDSLSKSDTSSGSRFPAPRPRLGSNRTIDTDTSQEVTSNFIQSEVNELNMQDSIPSIVDNSVDQSDGTNSEDVSEHTDENSSNAEINETEGEVTDDSANNEEAPDDTDKNDIPVTEVPKEFTQSWDLKSLNKMHILYTSVFLIIFAIFIPVSLVSIANTPQESFDFEALKEEFPTQEEDLWWAFEAGVQDVVTGNRPSTFILLYREESKDTLSSLLEQLSKYAVCNITDCSYKPIIITDSLLNSSEIVNDFGLMITKYKGELEEKGVMVIKNLENVRGVSAQAFHSFCDEYTPLVHKSLFIFTMKVDKLYGPDKMRFVEEYFKNKWTDVKVDTLNALITRISSMVLEVMP